MLELRRARVQAASEIVFLLVVVLRPVLLEGERERELLPVELAIRQPRGLGSSPDVYGVQIILATFSAVFTFKASASAAEAGTSR